MQELTCSICLNRLTTPKTLSCLHSFCHDCLVQLHTEDRSNTNKIKCPTCRSEVDLGDGGIDGLPTSFIVNNLIEVHDELVIRERNPRQCAMCGEREKNTTHHTLDQLVSDYGTLEPKGKVKKCPYHSKTLDIFCETCDELVCQHCIVKVHRDHKYDVLIDVYKEQCETIRANSILPVDSRIEECVAMMEQVNAAIHRLKHQSDRVKLDIQRKIQKNISALYDRFLPLMEEVVQITALEERSLERKKDEIRSRVAALFNYKVQVEQMLGSENPQQVVASKTKLMKSAQDVLCESDVTRFNQHKELTIELTKDDLMEMDSLDIGTINYTFSNTTLLLDQVDSSNTEEVSDYTEEDYDDTVEDEDIEMSLEVRNQEEQMLDETGVWQHEDTESTTGDDEGTSVQHEDDEGATVQHEDDEGTRDIEATVTIRYLKPSKTIKRKVKVRKNFRVTKTRNTSAQRPTKKLRRKI